MPSAQLHQYLTARASGSTVDAAANLAGFSLTEARLTEKAIEAGDLELPRARAGARVREEGSTKERNVMLTDEEAKITMKVGNGPEVPIDLKKDLDAPENAQAKEQMGGMFAKPATGTGETLKRYIERAERLDREIKDLNGDKSDLFKEMKSNGFDSKTVKRIIKLRKMGTHERQEAQALLSTYMDAIGMTPIEEAIALAAAA